MKPMILALLAAFAVLLFFTFRSGQSAVPQPLPDSATLVVAELFTSQGCSSCPPADALLAELAENPHILPLSFHVDYWNHIGWPDPFSSPESTARQRAYADRLESRVYTPQLVVGGQWEMVGSNRGRVMDALRRAQAEPPALALAAYPAADGGYRLELGAGEGEPAVVLLVEFDPAHSTAVDGGENGGRTLANRHVVRNLIEIDHWRGEAMVLLLPASSSPGLAVLVQEAPNGPILAALRLK